LFIDASSLFDSGKNQNRLNENHIKTIVDEFQKFKDLAPLTSDEGEILTDKFSYRATIKDIQDNEYNLNIPRYIDTFEEEAEVDIKVIHAEIIDLKKQLTATELHMDAYLKSLNLI
jgi:type I restriction enzyme M protein